MWMISVFMGSRRGEKERNSRFNDVDDDDIWSND